MRLIDFVRTREKVAFTFQWEDDGFTAVIPMERQAYERRGYQNSRDLAAKMALAKAQAHVRATRSISKETKRKQ